MAYKFKPVTLKDVMYVEPAEIGIKTLGGKTVPTGKRLDVDRLAIRVFLNGETLRNSNYKKTRGEALMVDLYCGIEKSTPWCSGCANVKIRTKEEVVGVDSGVALYAEATCGTANCTKTVVRQAPGVTQSRLEVPFYMPPPKPVNKDVPQTTVMADAW